MPRKLHLHDPHDVNIGVFLPAEDAVVLERIAKVAGLTRNKLIAKLVRNLVETNPPTREEQDRAEEIYRRQRMRQHEKKRSLGITPRTRSCTKKNAR